MKKLILSLITSFCLGSFGAAYAGSDSNFMDYKVDGNRFAIVYVDRDNVSSEEAQERALARAAQVAHDNGYRYFIVEKQDKVVVSQSPSSQNRFYDNAYESLIIEKNFSPDDLRKNTPQPSNMYPGLRIIIKGLKTNPTGIAYDTCKWLNC